jgi:hypothetical protein
VGWECLGWFPMLCVFLSARVYGGGADMLVWACITQCQPCSSSLLAPSVVSVPCWGPGPAARGAHTLGAAGLRWQAEMELGWGTQLLQQTANWGV